MLEEQHSTDMCKAKYGGKTGDAHGTWDLEESSPSLWGRATSLFSILEIPISHQVLLPPSDSDS